MLEQAASDPQLRRLFAEPHALDPAPKWGGSAADWQRGALYNQVLDAWTGPSVIAPLDVRIVRRSHALLGYPWGRQFHFNEGMNFGAGPLGRLLAHAGAVALSMGSAALGIGALRRMLARLLPAPGKGPSKDALRRGFFHVHFLAEVHGAQGAEKLTLRAQLSGQGEPGYAWSARMLAESALCLAFDERQAKGGVLTPASGLGVPLWRRLELAGLSFELTEHRENSAHSMGSHLWGMPVK